MIYNFIIFLFALAVVVFLPVAAQAKDNDDQTQIILLNDSAAALEDTDPDLSKSLTKFADEREKEWEDKTANKDVLPTPITDSYITEAQDHIKLLKAAAHLIQPTYPLIAQALRKMAHDINRSIELAK